jgi:Spy/CpxP family protein refolding chaperone
MRQLLKVCAVLALAALVAAPASAQQRQPGRGFGGGGGLEQLLANKSVQEEVKIDKDQATKIEEAIKKFREDNKDDYDKASFRNQDTKPEEKAEIRKKLNEKFTTLAKDLVKPEQMKRIKQIQLQQQGLQAYANEEVQKGLKITDEQKEKIKTIGDDLRKDIQDLGTGGNIQERFTKIREMTKEASEKVQKILTEEQKKAWKEMTGEPFQVRFEQPRRPGGTERPGRPGGTPPAQPKKIDF